LSLVDASLRRSIQLFILLFIMHAANCVGGMPWPIARLVAVAHHFLPAQKLGLCQALLPKAQLPNGASQQMIHYCHAADLPKILRTLRM
jgi:hypothetical protein